MADRATDRARDLVPNIQTGPLRAFRGQAPEPNARARYGGAPLTDSPRPPPAWSPGTQGRIGEWGRCSGAPSDSGTSQIRELRAAWDRCDVAAPTLWTRRFLFGGLGMAAIAMLSDAVKRATVESQSDRRLGCVRDWRIDRQSGASQLRL